MKNTSRKLLYIKLDDWTWWAWTITTGLLIAGLTGHAIAFLMAMGLTAIQGCVLMIRDGATAFSVQLRIAYLVLLLIAYPPVMRWFYWLPTVGTFALITFGYCLLARMLSLLPWNSTEPYTVSRLQRTFFSPPDLERVPKNSARPGCAGGLCTIQAQIAPPVPSRPT